MATQITDHAQRAVDRLHAQHKGKANLELLVRTLATPTQEIENQLFLVWVAKRIDTATGIELDAVGSLVNEPRDGRTDSDYRRILRAVIRANRSKARILDVIETARLVLTSSPTSQLLVESVPHKTVCLEVHGVAIPESLASDVFRLVERSVDGGTRLLVKYATDVDAEMFAFAMGTNANGAIAASATSIPTTGIPSGIPNLGGGTLTLSEGTGVEETCTYTHHDGTTFLGVSGVTNAHVDGASISFDDSLGKGFEDNAAPVVGGQLTGLLTDEV